MNSVREVAAPGKHHVDGPPRQNSSRCGNYHNTAAGLNQSSNGERRVTNNPRGEHVMQEIARREEEFAVIEKVVMQGDLSKLNPEQRVMYYRKVCESAGLNPFTNPFSYILLNGKLTLYAKKDCTEQLRKIHGVSIEGLDGRIIDDLYIVKAKARDKHGRTDESTGAVVIGNLKGEAKANAIMKAETKAKRRVTLSICGMGWTDESEIDSIPNAKPIDIDLSTGEIQGHARPVEPPKQIEAPKPRISREQADELAMILDDCDEEYRKMVYQRVAKVYMTEDLSGLPIDMFDRMKDTAIKNMEKHHAMQRAQSEAAVVAEQMQ